MTRSGKVELLMELYRNGFLCKCSKHDEIWDEQEYTYLKEIRHEFTCDARIKVMALLQEDISG